MHALFPFALSWQASPRGSPSHAFVGSRTRQYRLVGSHSTIPESSSLAPTTCSVSFSWLLGSTRRTTPCVYTCCGPSSLEGSLSRSVRELLAESVMFTFGVVRFVGEHASRSLSCFRSHAIAPRSVAVMPRALLACSAFAASAALPRRHRPATGLDRCSEAVAAPQLRVRCAPGAAKCVRARARTLRNGRARALRPRKVKWRGSGEGKAPRGMGEGEGE